MTELKDSGARKEFEGGAVRDLADGKGRCDLLPLDIIDSLIIYCNIIFDHNHCNSFLGYINEFIQSNNVDSNEYLYSALCELITKQWERKENNLYSAILELAIHYEYGARKYEANNWKKGIPIHCFIDSALRHYFKMQRGDDDEPHKRAVVWNLIGAIWTLKHRPDLDDIHVNVESNV